MESPGHHHHHKEGSENHHTKDCDKDGKPRASPPSQGRIRSLPYQGL